MIAISSTAIPAAVSASDGSRQWVHVLPLGKVFGVDGRSFQLDDAEKVINATRQFAGKRKLPIDYDHAIDLAAPRGGSAPAAGWIVGLQSRANGIWALVEWTEQATKRIDTREYRYISPVLQHAPDGQITRLLRASLTNNPNLELTALFSARTDMDDPLQEIRNLLGLGDTADTASIIAKIQNLLTVQNSAKPDPAQYVPIGDFERVATELVQIKQGVSLQQAQIHVDDKIGRGKLPPYLRDWGVALCQHNKPAFDAFTDRISGSMAHLFREVVPAGSPPGDANTAGALNSSTAGLSVAEAEVCRNLNLSPDDLKKSMER